MPGEEILLQTAFQRPELVLGANYMPVGVWNSISTLFGLLRGRTQHMNYDQAIAAANTQAVAIRATWQNSLSPNVFNAIAAAYYPQLIELMSAPVPGLDWWNPQTLINNVRQYASMQWSVSDRIGGAMANHFLWIYSNVDIDGGVEGVQRIFKAHFRWMMRDVPELNTPDAPPVPGDVELPGGLTGNPGTPTQAAIAKYAPWAVAGLAGWWLLGIFKRK